MGVVTAALLFINDAGIQAIQEVVTIVALPFFIMQGFIMVSLLKGMGDDFAAEKRLRTRRWEKTDTPEKLEQAENRPAPGYDKDGNEVEAPEFEYDEGDGWKLTGNVTVETDDDK